MTESKTVYFKDFDSAIEELNSRYDGIKFYNKNYNKGWDDPIELGVNWSAMGTMSAADTAKFAADLQTAAMDAASFKYNGCVVVYK